MFKSRLFLSVVTSLTLLNFASANEEPTLEARLEQLATKLDAARQDAHVPGMSIAIVKDDKIIWTRGFGYTNIEEESPADEHTVYGVGSTTKAFTATLLGMLVDEGKATWDDPVTQHLPYFDLQVRSDDENAECTLRDLLSHRHGFTRMGVLTFGDATRETVLRTAAGAEPWDDFRGGFHYCNVTYLAAGQAAGVAAGSTWDEMMVERIFKPLNMESSTLTLPEAKRDERLALGYIWEKSLKEIEHVEMMDLSVIGPAGSVNSNVIDMAQWIRLLLGKGEINDQRLISEESLQETWTHQIKIAGEMSYGLGWMLHKHRGRAVVEHGGNVMGFTAEVALMPEENLGYVLLMNLGMASLREASIGIVFDALLEEWPEEVPAETEAVQEIDLEEYTGFYLANFDSFRDERFEVRIANDTLSLDIPSQRTYELHRPNAAGLWEFKLTDQINISFQRNQADEISGFTLHQAAFEFDVPREGVIAEPEAPLEELQRYAGTYNVGTTGRQCQVVIKHGRLFFDSGKELMPLLVPDADGHAPMRGRADFGATFNTDAEGNIDSFVLHGARDRTMTRAVDSNAPDLPTLEAILALRETDKRVAAMKAAGGIKATGRVHFAQAGVRGSLTVFTQGISQHASYMDLGEFGRVDYASNGTEAWSYNPVLGTRTLKGEELLQAVLEHPAAVSGDWREHFDSVNVLRNDTLNERPVHVIRLTKEGIPSRTYSVDTETGDVLQVNMIAIDHTIRFPMKLSYSEFELVNGVRTPRRAELENPMSGRTILTIEKFESGLELDEETFRIKDIDSE